MVGAQRALVAFGDRGERILPRGLHAEALAVAGAGVEGLAPDARHGLHVHGAALPPLDLDRGHPHRREARQELERVEARGLLERVVGVAVHHEAAAAQGRIARVVLGPEAVDEHAAQARLERAAAAAASARTWPASSRRACWATPPVA